jgi:ketosteroid isomerase-like protein
MLTASPPFSAATREQMIKRRLSEEAPHIQHLDPGLPDSLDRVVNRLLARTPADRYGSAAEVRDALAGTHMRRPDAEGLVRAANMTPRSAPTQAFETAALAPTEQTEQARRPRTRLAMMAASVVVLLGAAFVVRDSAGDGAVGTVESAGAPVAGAPAKVVAPPAPDSVVKKPVVVVDSAARARSIAARLRRDSMRAALKSMAAARTASAVPAVAAPPGSVESAIRRYARAIEDRSVDKLKEAYPRLTDDEQRQWETNVFAIATKLKASIVDLRTNVDGDAAEADYRLDVTFDYNGSPAGQSKQQHATLKRVSGGWQIQSIRQP